METRSESCVRASCRELGGSMTFVLERPISISTRRKLLPLADSTPYSQLSMTRRSTFTLQPMPVFWPTQLVSSMTSHNKPRFQQLVESYNGALEAGDEPPCSKDPNRYSLYEFASMFDKWWGQLEPFKFVHVVPSIRRHPNKRTNQEFHHKFMLIILRLH